MVIDDVRKAQKDDASSGERVLTHNRTKLLSNNHVWLVLRRARFDNSYLLKCRRLSPIKSSQRDDYYGLLRKRQKASSLTRIFTLRNGL